jgi:hypothetical protein
MLVPYFGMRKYKERSQEKYAHGHHSSEGISIKDIGILFAIARTNREKTK